MVAFESQQTFYTPVSDLEPVVRETERHFRDQGFEVVGERRMSGAWDVSLTRSNLFKTVCGLKSALKIELVPQGGAVFVKAGIGIFGQQAIPSLVTWFVFWPVLVTQLWGLIQQSKLDEKALRVIGESLGRQKASKEPEPGWNPHAEAISCKACGATLPAGSAFCPACGAKV
jgi:hypothetical protein